MFLVLFVYFAWFAVEIVFTVEENTLSGVEIKLSDWQSGVSGR